MSETLADALKGSALHDTVLRTVATQDLDSIPPDFDDQSRFVISSIRAVARHSITVNLCGFLYSEAPLPEGKPLGFEGVFHIQQGHGEIESTLVLTSRDANNGSKLSTSSPNMGAVMTDIQSLGLDSKMAVIWDGPNRTATVYPNGIADQLNYYTIQIPAESGGVTQDEICKVLDAAHEGLKNPSGKTAHLFRSGKLVKDAEEEIERHLKGFLTAWFVGQSRPINFLTQVPITAGRTDIVVYQRPVKGEGPQLLGVIELKVLRGPLAADIGTVTEGLSQAYEYRKDMEVPFATLALYDVNTTPSNDPSDLTVHQDAAHLAIVRVRRFPIYNSPQAWRMSQIPSKVA